MQIFVDGSNGAAGVELVNQLKSSETLKDIAVVVLPNNSNKDKECRLLEIIESDISVLCLPNEVSKDTMNSLQDAPNIIIDASSEFRHKENWAYNYFNDNVPLDLTRYSNPGCFATGMITVIKLLENYLDDRFPLSFFGITGYSAAGNKILNANNIDSVTNKLTNFSRPHTHEAEVSSYFKDKFNITFCPYVGNFRRGQIVTIKIFKHNLTIPINEVYDSLKKQVIPNLVVLEDVSSINPSNYPIGFNSYIYVHLQDKSYINISAHYDNLGIGSSLNIVNLIERIINK